MNPQKPAYPKKSDLSTKIDEIFIRERVVIFHDEVSKNLFGFALYSGVSHKGRQD